MSKGDLSWGVENASPPVITFPRVGLTRGTFLYRSTESLLSGHRLLDGGSGLLCVVIEHGNISALQMIGLSN